MGWEYGAGAGPAWSTACNRSWPADEALSVSLSPVSGYGRRCVEPSLVADSMAGRLESTWTSGLDQSASGITSFIFVVQRPWSIRSLSSMPFSHHSHSGQFCHHAQDTLEAMVLAACDRGFHTFALTEHMPRRAAHLYPEEVRPHLSSAGRLASDR